MPLNSINLMEAAGFGLDCISGGVTYKIIMHLGADMAMAVRVPDPMPAQIYLIKIDPKPEEKDADKGGNGEDKKPIRTPAKKKKKLPDKNKPKKPVATIH